MGAPAIGLLFRVMVGVVRVKVKIMRAEFRGKGECWCCGWIFKDKVSGTVQGYVIGWESKPYSFTYVRNR